MGGCPGNHNRKGSKRLVRPDVETRQNAHGNTRLIIRTILRHSGVSRGWFIWLIIITFEDVNICL